MTDTSHLAPVLHKTVDIVAGVRPDQHSLPTPCPEFDVKQMVNHVVNWMRIFANGAAGDEQPADPDAYRSPDPAADARAAADKAVAAFADLADDAPVSVSSGSMPAAASAAMMTGEYLAHGWDLATATGQPIPYTDQEAEAAREGLMPLLSPEYRGPGMPFGNIVDVPEDSSALDRFLGFSGRDPGWKSGSGR